MDNGNGLFLVLPFLQAVLGVAFVFVARLGSRPARFWSAGYFVNAGAQSVPMLLAFAPDLVQAGISCSLFVASFAFFGLALRCRFRLPLRLSAHALFAILASLAAATAMVGFGSLRYEVLINDVTCALPIFVALCAVATRRRSAMDRTLVWMSAAVVADVVGRSLWFFANTGSEAGAETFLSSSYLAAMLIASTMAGLLYALTALFAEVLDILTGYRDGAERDPLTGLLNRRGFERALPGPSSISADGAVLTCDIDHFKRINDRHGHASGDRVIVVLAQCLMDRMPTGASAARFGGEEFVAFVPDIDLDAAQALADAVRRDFVLRTAALPGLSGAVTVSFGIARIDRGAPSVAAAIERADVGLLQAKAGGRDRVVCSEEPLAAGRPGPALVCAA